MAELVATELEPSNYQDAWYEVVEDNSLRQGDIFRNLNVFWPSAELLPFDGSTAPEGYGKLDFATGDYIIASASCDVDQANYPFVLLSRVLAVTEENLKTNAKELPKFVEVLRLGLVPSQFLLAPFDSASPSFPLSTVQHKVHVLVPTGYLKNSCGGKRLRLKHPIREKFGNWVGASFSRVGPEDATNIPKGAKVFPAHIIAANLDTEI